jgi:Fur family ferric uptake transcriptional regulator
MTTRPRHESHEAREDAARTALRAAGLRATPQRLAVYLTVQAAGGGHLSADDIWRQLAGHPARMDRSTVYRALADLAGKQLLTEVRLADGVARFEVQDVAHHHAVCIRCGATYDVEPGAVLALSRRLREATGFSLGTQSLLLPGLCARCAGQPAAAAPVEDGRHSHPSSG